ncbi:predicted protein [Streptomyces filamentosus NRRL 15998]|uniref:Predicted protein n=1 Tax=Streptomyces filamentosus NRRL 15998 TaxID=457431 RepID=D6AT41_STRFL|nr:predicted protein [Streptomyces filamentosus NRRL 15998]
MLTAAASVSVSTLPPRECQRCPRERSEVVRHQRNLLAFLALILRS